MNNCVYYDLPDRIDVLMSGDKNVLEGISLNCLSAVLKTDIPITFHICTCFSMGTKGLTLSDIESLKANLKKVKPETEVEYIDSTKNYDEWFKNSPNKKPAYSVCSLLRLFAEDYVFCKRLIYLDADIMSYGDLKEFFRYDISDKEIAVVKDYMGKFWIKRDYFNSGVLFINMDEIKKEKTFLRSSELLSKKKFYLADQTALYKSSKKRLYLPDRFNEQRKVKPDTVIKHFNKGIKWLPFFHIYNVKQWQRERVHKKLKIFEFDDVFEIYDKIFKEKNTGDGI